MIPKIIHQIWIGDNKCPIEYKQFSFQWKDMYSEYKYILWDNNAINELPLSKNIAYILQQNFPIALKVDILRYFILLTFGGIYVDIDTEPLKKMDMIFSLSFFSGYQQNNEIAIGIIGSIPHENTLNYIFVNAIENVFKYANTLKIKYIDQITGPGVFTEKYKESIYDKTNHYIFESKYFYPYWYLENERRFENFKLTCPDAYSVHHWAHMW